MAKKEKTPKVPEPREERGPAASTPPRGNPETEHQSVAKGEEQLEKISGN